MNPALKSFLENRFKNDIRAQQQLPACEGDFCDFPADLDEKLATALRQQGIEKLFSHQSQAFESISAGNDTVIVSQTASGKTLSFSLPILHNYIQEKAPFSVLLLYPTKALSRDQEGTLGALLQRSIGKRLVGTYDGDTPREERSKMLKSADFVVTNPDMLHSGILPNHNRKWRNFLSRLRYIVVDEVHSYRGSFGSHVSNVFRRLLRVCEIHGSSPTFVACSATIANPAEQVTRLFHREFTVIDSDGAPRPSRDIYFINPSLKESASGAMYRRGPASVSIQLIRQAAKLGVRTICFCRARQEVERLYKAVIDGNPQYRSIVKPYRGGLLPNERRKLERDLFDGSIKVILTTNALELGIDIGDLDFCILSGHPGTMASFWQQAGRVGRKGSGAAIVFLAKDVSVDQYIVHHPEYVTSAPVEQAWLNADNPYVLIQHLPCAAHEHPLRPEEPLYDHEMYQDALEVLRSDKVVVPYRKSMRYAQEDYPARGVNLRGMTDYNVEIYCGTEVIGELDPIGARGTLYKDAIYQHLGRRYMSMDLDLDKKLCNVEPVEVDYYTEAVWEGDVSLTEQEEFREIHGQKLRYGDIHVNKQPKLYKKIRERSLENIGYGPITLPAFEYDTTGFCLLPSVEWREGMSTVDKRYIAAGVYGLSYILKRTAPCFCMGDVKDLGVDVSLAEFDDEQFSSALYVYDSIEGGVGYSEKVYERFTEVLEFCMHILDECECQMGCPACVPPLPSGVEDQELEELMVETNAALQCARSYVTSCLTGEIVIPEVTSLSHEVHSPVTPPPIDVERQKMQSRLRKASKMLQKKRDRKH